MICAIDEVLMLSAPALEIGTVIASQAEASRWRSWLSQHVPTRDRPIRPLAPSHFGFHRRRQELTVP
jgi:hypothetical protein